MKIEKISDTQIKIILNQADLKHRDIKISELAYGSKKAQDLFRDMMEAAFEEYGFDVENAPLMIEAVPLSMDSIMIIVTKVENPEEIEEKLNAFRPKPNTRTFKKKTGVEEKVETNNLLIYSFNTLNDVVHVSSRIYSLYCGINSLYKDINNGKYFLVLHKNYFITSNTNHIEAILSEYGEKHKSSPLSEEFLNEHGELMIKNNAIEILKKHLA
ncbi:adaptor protein MecA [Defluviitalea phaphyphila]|uniref:adaptor protein MecA n=1 Tax=Defluviitalea phaphyphila TaxID=1473580 RepID=UPI0007316C24|nr:adaptor protein MecA [Defluviitalea phaphyphila]